MTAQVLSNKTIFIFWAPLLFLWLVLAFEFPLLTIIITYLPDKQLNLAAFGLAYSLFLLAESPLLMFNTVAIKLIKNKQSYEKVRNFFIYVVSFLLICMMLFVLTPLYQYLFITRLSFDRTIAVISQHVVTILLPAFAIAGFKAFYQGVLISRDKQPIIFYAIIFRFISSVVTAVCLANFSSLNSAYVAAIGFSIGLFVEATITRVFARKPIHGIFEVKSSYKLSYYRISHFYYPLIITTVASIITTPIITIFLNYGLNPTLSLAVFPVINGFIMIFKSTAMSLQNVVIYFLNLSEENKLQLKKFFALITLIMFAVLFGIIFTPLLNIYLTKINVLQSDLSQAAVLPLKILIIYPLLTLLVIWQRSVIIHQLKTHVLTWSVFAELIGLVLPLVLFYNFYPMNGLLSASIALIIGRVCSNILLFIAQTRIDSLSHHTPKY
ncbi:hypothetical protein [Legionella sp. PC997]|uniref:hypothetical protein n=1 Tax=Legionella sp. PC997 TaxID=2755562 RepID=UPI0015FD5C5B|nr:hypothetical protein [Legionella sp. PC997]QMT59142.1 hypothetical protein HBNCFIEN_00503 [Legionella sp. PC997]